jgi:hypothetical protein
MSDRFNLLEQPEELLRLTVPDDIRYCIVSLLRFLQAARPSFQEEHWSIQADVAAGAPGTWFELRKRGVPTGYTQAEASRGRYTSIPPRNVAGEEIRPLEVPDPPPTVLREFLSLMIDRLAEHDAGAASNFLPYRNLLTESEDTAGYLATRQLTSALAAGAGLRVPEAAVMVEFETKLLELFNSFKMRGEVVGILLMLCLVAQKADPQRALTVALQSTPKTTVHDIAGFGDFVLSGVISQAGGAGWINEAAQGLNDSVEAKLDEAAAASSTGNFYGAIYSSIPFAYGAKRGFGFLSRSAPGDEAAHYAVLANQCDERFAHGMAALQADFGNSMDSRFVLSHRRMVERQRRLRGETSAEATTIELIDTSMMYPAFFRAFLLGKTNALTTKVT